MMAPWLAVPHGKWARICAGTSIILIKHAKEKLIFLKDPLARNEVFALQKFLGRKSYTTSEND
jgi:hypothetical protein